MFLRLHIFIFLQGELEQLTVVDETFGGVSEQCSPNKVPFLRQEIAEKMYDDNNNDFHIEESSEKKSEKDDHLEKKRKTLQVYSHFISRLK